MLTARHLAGMLAAVLAPALLLGAITAIGESSDLFAPMFVGGLIVAGIHVGVLAMPIFAMLATRWEPRLWSTLLASFAIGAGPASLLFLPWGGDLELSLVFGGFGLSGGLAFWLVVNRPWRRGSCR
jgi:hypothetical protein